MKLIAVPSAAVLATLMCAFAIPAHADEKSSPLPTQMPIGQQACFGRDYDANHLASHPKQRVTSLYLFRDFTPDTNSEFEPDSPDSLRENDGVDGRIGINAYVRLRDRKGVYSNSFSCSKSDSGGVSCAIDCDGGSFRLKSAGESLDLANEGFVVVGGCGSSEEDDNKREDVRPGVDDKQFRLSPQPLAACIAIRDTQRPAYAARGAPIRQRLAATGALCFTKSYDTAHLTSYPQQQIRRVAVLKTATDADNAPSYRLSFRIELRNGDRREKSAHCYPDGYTYLCTSDTDHDGAHEFYLTRAGDNDIMLRDRRGAMTAMLKAKVGVDDKIFKLRQAPEADCGF
ncbi:hypothetical protein [Bradyrhizobium prioriisuperbiae]|uniref:hypothetical protein n=1 Tax=Bradyrhizobium prioriisuperbiae TaxID=2854389 RepID=UPI0028EE97B4|nr:hypothetical protein [Bradyrhizobium prioritasuperba]